MTPKSELRRKILAMPAGDEIDLMVSKEVLGLKAEWPWMERYSVDLEYAFAAADLLNKQWFFDLSAGPGDYSTNPNPKWTACFWDGEPCIAGGVGHVSGIQEYKAGADTPELAICRAALLCALKLEYTDEDKEYDHLKICEKIFGRLSEADNGQTKR